MSTQDQPVTFLSLIEVHDRLNELFLSHQEALLSLDLPLARERLDRFERELLAHMRDEEELLLPVFQRAGRILGGPPEFFTGEHEKLRAFIERFRKTLAELDLSRTGHKREIIELFDDQATFKSLLEHHDQREQSILYPTLDRVTDEDERRGLLRRCGR